MRSSVRCLPRRGLHVSLFITLTARRHMTTTAVQLNSATAASEEEDRLSTSLSPARPLKRFSVVRPDLVDDWVPEMNEVDVQSVPCSHPSPTWWRCPLCHKTYQATIKARLAKEAMCCPRCQGYGLSDAHSTSASPAEVRSGPVPVNQGGETETQQAQPLSTTHPHVAALWDHERNGTLKPEHVTADSTVNVWWWSDQASPKMTRFRRAVFVMVHDAVSPQDKRIAEAALEESLLQRIHDAAHVEVAEPSTSLPSASLMFASRKAEDTAGRHPLRTVPMDQHGVPLSVSTPVTAGPALELWKQRVLAEASQHGSAPQHDEAQEGRLDADDSVAVEARPVPEQSGTHTGRALFYHSTSTATTDAWSRGRLIRQDLLNSYAQFVDARRRSADDGVAAPASSALPLSVLGAALAAGEAGTDAAQASADGWLAAFRLTRAQASSLTTPRADADLSFGRQGLQRQNWSARGVRTSVSSSSSSSPRSLLSELPPLPTSPAQAPSCDDSSRTDALANAGNHSRAAGAETDVLRNYPRLPRHSDWNTFTAAASDPRSHRRGVSGAGRGRAETAANLVGHAAVIAQNEEATDAIRDAMREALSGSAADHHSSAGQTAKADELPNSTRASSALLGVALAAEDAVARQHALLSPRRRRHGGASDWTPEKLLHDNTRRLDTMDTLEETTSAGYPLPVVPRKLKRVRLQPPAELRGALSDDTDEPGHAAHAMGSSAASLLATIQSPTRNPALSQGAPAAEEPAAPTLTAPRTPRKVARPSRRVHSS